MVPSDRTCVLHETAALDLTSSRISLAEKVCILQVIGNGYTCCFGSNRMPCDRTFVLRVTAALDSFSNGFQKKCVCVCVT